MVIDVVGQGSIGPNDDDFTSDWLVATSGIEFVLDHFAQSGQRHVSIIVFLYIWIFYTYSNTIFNKENN